MEMDQLEEEDIDGRIRLKWIFKRNSLGRSWTELCELHLDFTQRHYFIWQLVSLLRSGHTFYVISGNAVLVAVPTWWEVGFHIFQFNVLYFILGFYWLYLKRGTGNIFVWLADMCQIQQTCCHCMSKFYYKLGELMGSDWYHII